jgi:miniconductance mechanosensitive channel
MSEVDSYNMNNDIDKSLAINGRNITNLGLFRKYVTQYLNNHPGINQNLLALSSIAIDIRGSSFRSVCFYKTKNGKIMNISCLIFLTILLQPFLIGLGLYELRSNSEFIKQT